jgi:hypothetical protein
MCDSALPINDKIVSVIIMKQNYLQNRQNMSMKFIIFYKKQMAFS